MSYDNWKTSPPCPECGTPDCICACPSEDPAEHEPLDEEIDARLDDAEVIA